MGKLFYYIVIYANNFFSLKPLFIMLVFYLWQFIIPDYNLNYHSQTLSCFDVSVFDNHMHANMSCSFILCLLWIWWSFFRQQTCVLTFVCGYRTVNMAWNFLPTAMFHLLIFATLTFHWALIVTTAQRKEFHTRSDQIWSLAHYRVYAISCVMYGNLLLIYYSIL